MTGLLEGKCAVVTGAASGIGRASASLFAAEGARVLAADVSDDVHQTAADIEAAGGKAGVISLAQTIASQLRGTGVRINAICPGLIETGMTKPIFDYTRARGTEHRLGQLNPTTRHGEPDEIAQMAAFLGSDRASYVNGQAIAVDGGLSCGHPFVVPRVVPRRR